MNNECIQCGLPFHLYDTGYLFIRSKKDHPKFSRFNEGWLTKNYHSVEELERMLKEACELFEEKEVEAGISEKNVIPKMNISLPSLYSRVRERATVEMINHGSLVSYLQPIINLKNDRQIYGYESLLRTESPEQIPPGKLFGTAHEAGLLSLLDKRAREAAIKAKK